MLDELKQSCYSQKAGDSLFFMLFFRLVKLFAMTSERKVDQSRILTEVEVVRTKITLACTECKQRNYNMTKDKKTHPDRMETKKYCRFCKKHTMHKETK